MTISDDDGEFGMKPLQVFNHLFLICAFHLGGHLRRFLANSFLHTYLDWGTFVVPVS